MSKLVLFLFLGVCVMAVHMEAVGNDNIDDEAALEEFVNSLKSKFNDHALQDDDPRFKINLKKAWEKAKPILKEIAKVAKPIAIEAAKAAAAAAAAAAAGAAVAGGK